MFPMSSSTKTVGAARTEEKKVSASAAFLVDYFDRDGDGKLDRK